VCSYTAALADLIDYGLVGDSDRACRRSANHRHLPLPKRTAYNEERISKTRKTMPLSGEAIRLMNYIDDVAVTLRRVLATIPTLTADERARVAEHLLNAKPNAEDVADALAAK
jgi:hypothetical protein